MEKCIVQEEVTLERILMKRSVVKLFPNGGPMWYVSTIQDVEGNEFTLALPEVFAAAKVVLEDTLNFIFTDDKYEYNFSGELKSVRVCFPGTMKLRLQGEIKRSENIRGAKRMAVMLPANIILKNGEAAFPSCVKDISSTGIRIASKYSFRKGQEVDVHIALPFRNVFDSILRFKGKIIWERAGFAYNEYGIAATSIDEESRSRLELFLSTCSKHP